MSRRVFSKYNLLLEKEWEKVKQSKIHHLSMGGITSLEAAGNKLSPFINLITVVSTDLQYEVVAYLSELSLKGKFRLNKHVLGHNYIQQNRNFKAVLNLLTVLRIEIDFRWTDWCSLPSALKTNLLMLAENNWYYL